MLRSTLAILPLTMAIAAMAQAPAPVAAAAPAAALAHSNPSESKEHQPSVRDRNEAQQLFLDGAKELEHGQMRAAVDAFGRAARLDPGNNKYAFSEQIAREHVVTDLIQQADKEKIMGHFPEAQADLAEALRIDPADPVIAQHADELAADRVAGEPAVRTATVAPPIELRPKAIRLSFHLRASERDLISQVLPAYGIQPTLDDSVGVQMVRYDVDNADFATIERTLGPATGTFLVPLDPGRALVAKNTRANHEKYERQALETLYMPGLKQDELTGLVQIAKDFFAASVATADDSEGTLTVRAPAREMKALNATLTGLMEGQNEVQLDVRLFEIDRTKAQNLGAILPNQTTLFNVYSEARSLLNSNSSLVQEIVSSGLAAPGDWEAILAILIGSGQISSSIFSGPFGVFGGGLTMTGVAYQGGSLNMQLNSSDVRALDQIQLRLLDHEEGTIKAGERYPIETSSYSSLSASSLSIPGISSAGLSSTLQNLGVSASALESAASETIPQVQYQDIGLSLQVTPRVASTRDVSLTLHLTLSALAGAALNGLPELANREYSAITSVPIGQSAFLMSALSRQESDAITGIPGLSEIPGFQDATNNSTNLNVSELVIVITPHLVRSVRQAASEKMILLPHEP
ncbi:MAG TPA: hypothetical protein VHZ09_00855 [Acidobacteriaceae bacterium]|jgi:Flp pilus assembly secretin CpaC|nr:hypothetical protein [Acidobacteriaceae bacterium]